MALKKRRKRWRAGSRDSASRSRAGRRGRLADERLLKLRLKDLKLPLRGTWLSACLRELNAEMAEKGLRRVRAHGWISSEWFSPGNTPGIAFPFYLAHPRLMRLERKMIIDVEGGTHAECMRILRHEAGHVLQHSYALHKQPRWRRLFGRSSIRYPKYYRADPTSRNFVQHLRLWYAQSHPDEDFAETFAVWLTPRSNWRKRYEGWPALKKLQYVDELMAELADRKPVLSRRTEVEPLRSAAHDARRALPEEARALFGRRAARLRPRSACASSPTIRGTGIRRRPRPSSAITAATSGGLFPSGPASISSRSTRCSTR